MPFNNRKLNSVWYGYRFCNLANRCKMPAQTMKAFHANLSPFRTVRRSLLRAGVQPTLDPSVETFISVQCASPGRGGELVGVCGVCASCVGWRRG